MSAVLYSLLLMISCFLVSVQCMHSELGLHASGFIHFKTDKKAGILVDKLVEEMSNFLIRYITFQLNHGGLATARSCCQWWFDSFFHIINALNWDDIFGVTFDIVQLPQETVKNFPLCSYFGNMWFNLFGTVWKVLLDLWTQLVWFRSDSSNLHCMRYVIYIQCRQHNVLLLPEWYVYYSGAICSTKHAPTFHTDLRWEYIDAHGNNYPATTLPVKT